MEAHQVDPNSKRQQANKGKRLSTVEELRKLLQQLIATRLEEEIGTKEDLTYRRLNSSDKTQIDVAYGVPQG